jgi:Glycosyl transferase family 2
MAALGLIRMDQSNLPLRYSVVLPAHRADDYLLQAVRSVEQAIGCAQGELIVVANGPERTKVADAVVRVRTLASTRVEISELPSLIHCLNRGIELARGQFVARFDSDDVCLPDRFENQYALALSSNADFLFSDAEVINEAGEPTGECKRSSATLWKRCGPIHPTAFMRREALLRLGGYGNLEYSEDYHLWLRAQSRRFTFAVLSQSTIRYRVHTDQATDRSRLTETFATNLGLKMIVGLRSGKASLIFGGAIDAASWVYRKCRNAFF